jgi:hypothetical protein
MSWALLEWRLDRCAGFKVTRTLAPNWPFAKKSAQRSTESKRADVMGAKNGFFWPGNGGVPGNYAFSHEI